MSTWYLRCDRCGELFPGTFAHYCAYLDLRPVACPDCEAEPVAVPQGGGCDGNCALCTTKCTPYLEFYCP